MAKRPTVRCIVVSSFALDGGAMHGIVPRPLWQRLHIPDEKNRIRLVARLVLVDDQATGARTLVELGMGQRWSAKERAIYGLDDGPDVQDALRAASVDPETITHVVLTHLHWDHAGGLVRSSGEQPELSFPRAEHVIGARCLAHAMHPSDKDAGSFRHEDLELLLARGKTRIWERGPLAPGLEGRISDGHTEGLLIPMVPEREDGPPLAVPTDLIPTRSHLKPNWVMAYDNAPTVTVREKQELIADLARIGGGVVLYHDPEVEAAWAVASPSGPVLVAGRLDSPPSV